MKKLALFLFLSLLAFTGSFMAAQMLEMKKEASHEVLKSLSFLPASYVLKNRPFAIVVVGYNNGATVEKTLTSVFSQNYENYRLIYIDDASDNGSYDLARDLVYESGHLAQTTLIRNEQRFGNLASIFKAVQICQDDEIVVVLQGEDWLAHEWVLQRLNAYYADPDLWLGLCQTIDFPTYQVGDFQNLKKVDFRLQFPSFPYLKTFYAALFKKIRESDFISSGTFLPACAELAYMAPMLEMGQGHVEFIPEVLGVNNRRIYSKEDPELCLKCEKFIRALDPYQPLTALMVNPCGD
jgi:glycosyltransferase involved in cell wall biosynthesis